MDASIDLGLPNKFDYWDFRASVEKLRDPAGEEYHRQLVARGSEEEAKKWRRDSDIALMKMLNSVVDNNAIKSNDLIAIDSALYRFRMSDHDAGFMNKEERLMLWRDFTRSLKFSMYRCYYALASLQPDPTDYLLDRLPDEDDDATMPPDIIFNGDLCDPTSNSPTSNGLAIAGGRIYGLPQDPQECEVVVKRIKSVLDKREPTEEYQSGVARWLRLEDRMLIQAVASKLPRNHESEALYSLEKRVLRRSLFNMIESYATSTSCREILCLPDDEKSFAFTHDTDGGGPTWWYGMHLYDALQSYDTLPDTMIYVPPPPLPIESTLQNQRGADERAAFDEFTEFGEDYGDLVEMGPPLPWNE